MSQFSDFFKKPDHKFVYSLRKIYGIGLSSAKAICQTLGYDIDVKNKNIYLDDFEKLDPIIRVKFKFKINADLKRTVFNNINNMKTIKSYKGIRHSYNMPVNGQRTRTNAKTRGWI